MTSGIYKLLCLYVELCMLSLTNTLVNRIFLKFTLKLFKPFELRSKIIHDCSVQSLKECTRGKEDVQLRTLALRFIASKKQFKAN